MKNISLLYDATKEILRPPTGARSASFEADGLGKDVYIRFRLSGLTAAIYL